MRTAEKFWESVRVTGGCWEWLGANVRGRARVNWFSKPALASRISYQLARGPIREGFFLLHTCDNGNCVNPWHLYEGKWKENARDRENRKRGRGPAIKIPYSHLDLVRQRVSAGETHQEIASDYGVSRSAISLFITGKDRRAYACG